MSIKGVFCGIMANWVAAMLIIFFNEPAIILIPGMFVGVVIFVVGYALGDSK